MVSPKEKIVRRRTTAVLNKESRKAGSFFNRVSDSLPAFLLSSFFCLLTAETKAEITVGAAISISDAVTEISAAYEKETGKKVRLSFAGTNVISRQIEAGAPIDLFLSADTAHMDTLVAKGLVEKETVRTIASNELVVIVPAESEISLKSASELLSLDRIAIADPTSVPAGIYAKKWLEAEFLWTKIQHRTIPLQNVRAALIAAETGNSPAAIVYRSDAASSRKVKIALTADPARTGSIEYPAAIVNASSHKPEALAFLTYLATEESRKALTRHGFSFPEE